MVQEMHKLNKEDDLKNLSNHTKALEYLDIIRKNLQFKSAAKILFSYLYKLTRTIFQIHLKK